MRTAEKIWRSKVKKWFAECHKMTLGKSSLCRVPGRMTLGKEFFLKKFKFELHVVRIMEFNDSTNDSHVTECSVRPYPGPDHQFRTSCSRNMTMNSRSSCF